MKTYFADTNFYLRFILRDNRLQAKKTDEYLEEAKKGNIEITFLSSIILEMDYVLRSVYSLDRGEITKYLGTLIETPYLNIEDRNVWAGVFEIYQSKKISLIDIYLHLKAEKNNAEVLSFDKDFRKLARMRINWPNTLSDIVGDKKPVN